MSKFTVTPWKVEGDIDYEKLVRDFGTKIIDDKLTKRIEKHTGELHPLLKRKLFFSHRDLNIILDKYEKGEKFALYTGRGPSGHTHIGHLLPWIFTKWLQDKFDVELYFQLTDDEKFLFNKKLELDQTMDYAMENALDIIACGFKPGKTFIFRNTDYINNLYKIILKVAKKTTTSTAKAVFGFTNETNIGLMLFPAIQAAPCFLPSELKGKKVPVLIPAAIDQDSYWRGVARECAEKLGYYKPAQIHCRFLPGLAEGGKMSASDPNSAIFTTDKEDVARKKISRSFTGGRATAEEQKKLGGQPTICPIYQYYQAMFSETDKDLEQVFTECTTGKILCGECKAKLADRVVKFLKNHQEKREKAKKQLDKFLVKDKN